MKIIAKMLWNNSLEERAHTMFRKFPLCPCKGAVLNSHRAGKDLLRPYLAWESGSCAHLGPSSVHKASTSAGPALVDSNLQITAVRRQGFFI